MVAPKYGLLARWYRLRNLVPQQVTEDILTTILRNDKVTSLATIERYVRGGSSIGRGLTQLVQEGMLSGSDEKGYELTVQGRENAEKVLKAHRLWEVYLETIGTPQEQVHATAHHLEHISDTETVGYLDEKLGSPEADPHGRAIKR